MTPVYGHDAEIGRFVGEHIEGGQRGFANFKAIGFVNKAGELVAGMVYHNWSPEAGVIEMSGAATDPRWLTRPNLIEIFDYPFRRIGCQMVIMRVSEDNKRLHRQLYAYGFKSHKIPRLRGRDKAEIIFTLTDDDWLSNKFMRPKNGKIVPSAAA